MKKLKFHFRTTWRKIYIPVSVIIFTVCLYNLLFDKSSFKLPIDYKIGWFCLFVLIVVPNIALIIESIKDWKKK